MGDHSRSATISSGTPLKHKDKLIKQETRERFEALDLETLLSEFRRVAETEEAAPVEEEEPDNSDDAVIQEQQAWLQSTGFETLAQQFQGGRAITDEDVQMATAGFTAHQRRAVATRANVLNETLSKRGSKAKPDARALFAPPAAASTASAAAGTVDAPAEMGKFVEQQDGSPTHIQDLSEEDQQQLRRLSIIQLTAILEERGVTSSLLQKRKRKRRKPVGRVFGGSLVEMVERDRRSNAGAMKEINVPIFLIRVLDFLRANALEEEGLFRKAGSAVRIKALRDKVEEKWGDVNFDELDFRAHDVAAALKQFLRETCEPLLTDDCIEAFSQTQSLPNQVYGLQLLITLLPKVHAHCLEMLLLFLREVADKSSVNKMSIANLSVVFAPTLFYLRGSKGQQMLKEVEIQVTTASTLKKMLENVEQLWIVPPDMLAQMRFVNDSRQSGVKTGKEKELRKLLAGGKLASAKPSAGTAASDGMVLWVTDSKSSPPVRAITSVIMATGEVQSRVSITDDTTAEDVLKLTHSPPNCMLFECGGNLNRRRLSGSTRILQILTVNPGATLMAMSST